MPNCIECKDGEHDNYTEDVKKYKVTEPDSNKQYRRGFICSDHVDILLTDGYELTRVN